MHYFFTLFATCLLLPLSAGWNETFDEESTRLVHQFSPLQNPNYRANFRSFTQVRKTLLQDNKVARKVQRTVPEKKCMIIKKKANLIIKKRRHNHIHDLFVWELSHLLGYPDCIVPSFPIDVMGKRVIVQQLEPLLYGDTIQPADLQKISLETYWLAHLQAYLLGLSDLAGRNIGISPDGRIRFFDNEASFIYYNAPRRTERSFTSGFLCQSFDWPQYETALDRATAARINDFIQKLSPVKELLPLYLAHRPLLFPQEGLFFRLEKVSNFHAEEGMTFRDFYKAAFPQIAPGLSELNQIVSEILHEKIGDGTTLFYICRRMNPSQVPLEQKAAIQKWVATYIPENVD